MRLQAFERPSIFSKWTSRVAMFSVLLALTAAALHRLFGMPTPVALNLVLLALAGALMALALGILGVIGIWQSGRDGAARVVLGIIVSLMLLSVPFIIAAKARDYPEIYDLTTDVRDAPEFIELSKARGPASNGAEYRGDKFATLQQKAYPDLVPLRIDRSVNEAFELVVDAVKRQGLTLVSEIAPEGSEPGHIEAVDRTLVFGFYDDVAIRVTGDATGARVDIRSASRFGRNDLGQNADRMRSLMREIVVRLEETVPTAETDRKADEKKARPGLKQDPDDDSKPARRRKQRDPSLSDAQRGPGQKGRQPPRAYDQDFGIQPGRSFQ